jgi:thioredoxin 1
MPILTLSVTNVADLRNWLRTETPIIACLCAAWCDVCRDYRDQFESLAQRHPDKHFVWIDIEDQVDLVGDFDIENFPTLLIQQGAHVTFFGSVQPALQLADRLQAQTSQDDAALAAQEKSNPEWHNWQSHLHLARRLVVD